MSFWYHELNYKKGIIVIQNSLAACASIPKEVVVLVAMWPSSLMVGCVVWLCWWVRRRCHC